MIQVCEAEDDASVGGCKGKWVMQECGDDTSV